MLSRLVARWQGVALTLIGLVATVWLALTGRLGLYIHPRYYVFTVAMALIASVFALAAFAFAPAREQTDGDEERRMPRLSAALGIVIVAVAALALLVLPPATLSSATLQNRELNAAATTDDALLARADYDAFTVRDWAALLTQNPDSAALAEATATITGFVTGDAAGSDEVFYVARFVVSCCAVDAQPVGVPVHLPGWAEQLDVDSWVEVSGGFGVEPGGVSERTVLIPASVTPVDEPAEPYVY